MEPLLVDEGKSHVNADAGRSGDSRSGASRGPRDARSSRDAGGYGRPVGAGGTGRPAARGDRTPGRWDDASTRGAGDRSPGRSEDSARGYGRQDRPASAGGGGLRRDSGSQGAPSRGRPDGDRRPYGGSTDSRGAAREPRSDADARPFRPARGATGSGGDDRGGRPFRPAQDRPERPYSAGAGDRRASGPGSVPVARTAGRRPAGPSLPAVRRHRPSPERELGLGGPRRPPVPSVRQPSGSSVG